MSFRVLEPYLCRVWEDGHQCPNRWRYLTSTGQKLCGIHDAKLGVPSVRESDLPALIAKVTLMMRNDLTIGDETLKMLKELVCHSGS